MRGLEKEAESVPGYQYLMAVGRNRRLVAGQRAAAAAEGLVLGLEPPVLKGEEGEEAV